MTNPAAWTIVSIPDGRILFLRLEGETLFRPALFARYSEVEIYLNAGLHSLDGTPLSFEFWEAVAVNEIGARALQDHRMEAVH